LADETPCPRCSAANPSGTGFCGKCGADLAGARPTDARPDPLIGAFVGERFLVRRKLGEGGMGVVYEAEQTAIGRKVALKVIHPYLTDESLIARFRNEAAAASRLDHPNTITVFDFGRTETGALYIAMEFIEGVSLDDAMRRGGALEWRRAARVAAQICGSLANAHEHGIVHRDLKPENVMLLRRGGEQDIVKVLDFGIAKILEDDGTDQRLALTRTGMVLGTPQYMSPEQIRGEKVDARSDLYSAGVIVYQMLSGAPPFDSGNPLGLLTKHLMDPPPPFARPGPAAAVPPEFERLVMRMLAKSAAERPQTMGEVAERIEALLAPTPIAAAAPKRSKGGMIAGIAAGALLLAGGGGVAAWYFAAGSESPAPGAFPPIVGVPPITDPRPPAPQIPGQPTAGPPLVPLQAVPIGLPPVAGPPAVKRKKSELPKPWETVDGGMTKEEIGSLLKDKYGQIKKKIEEMKKNERDTDSGG
jgi:serine/threonine-protein kinase